MAQLDTFGTPMDKHLLNSNGRLSDCLCCCDVPPLLFLHWVPLYGSEDCEQNDQGPPTPGMGDGLTYMPTASHCEDWFYTDPDNQEFDWQCYPEVIGGNTPQGLALELWCEATDSFQARLCLDTLENPENFPDDESDCFEILSTVDGTLTIDSARTCNAGPGEFYIDFGSVQPSFCDCPFHMWVDEHAGIVTFELSPVYLYPAEAAHGVPFLTARIKKWELMDGVGTPFHTATHSFQRVQINRPIDFSDAPATLVSGWAPSSKIIRATRRVVSFALPSIHRACIKQTIHYCCGKALQHGCGAGYALGQFCRDVLKIEYTVEDPGSCNCAAVMQAMNKAGVRAVLENLDHWTNEVHESAKVWYAKRAVEGADGS